MFPKGSNNLSETSYGGECFQWLELGPKGHGISVKLSENSYCENKPTMVCGFAMLE